MIRPENMPRRQRWLEPQANLMNRGVSFPLSSVQEFYHYGGTGGFGTPFVAPFWGYASNFPSSSLSSSSSHVKESVVKKETPVVQKEVEKSKAEIYDQNYDEIAFPKNYDGKDETYDETAFSRGLSRSKGKQSRVSAKVRAFAKTVNDEALNNMIKKGDDAIKKKDSIGEGTWHREALEHIIKKYGKDHTYNDFETKQIYAYDSISHHHPSVVSIIDNIGKSLDDVFFYVKEKNWYFMKKEWHDYFKEKNLLYPELIHSG